MESGLGSLVQITRFGGENYPQWKFQVMCALKAKGLYGHATGLEGRPISNGTNASDISTWDKKDAMAMCILTSTMEIGQVCLIENCNTSKEILDKLDSIYEAKSESNKMVVHERFYQYRMDVNDSVAKHISKVESLARNIKNAGDSISEVAIITKILSSLPSKYGAFRQAWLSVEENKQTLANLTSRLIDEENSINHQTTEETVLYSSSKSKSGGSTTAKKPKKSFSCYNCGKKNHYARDCRLPKKNGGKNNNQNSEFDGGNAFNAETNEVSQCCSSMDWLMDSGASKHMCYIPEWFSSMREVDNLKVKLGNDDKLSVRAIGTIEIETLVNGRWSPMTIEDVWYVPDLKRNLFSEGVVTMKGFRIKKDDRKAEITFKGKTVAVAVRDSNNLYKMMIKPRKINNEANFVGSLTLKEWHERLGHLNVKRLKELHAKKLTDGVKIDDFKEFFCEACVYAKQHREIFNKTGSRENKPGELIHTDVCGPMAVDSVGGARYFLLIKDDFSGYREVRFIKHKSQVFDKFKDFIKMFKNKFGYQIKRVRSDNGGEFVNLKMNELFLENGIVLETTGIYSPQQNGRSERDNRTIMESARAMMFQKDVPPSLWAEAVNTAVYILNRTPTTQAPGSTPLEKWSGKVPNLGHTRTFGCDAYLLLEKNARKKLDKKSQKFILVGYDNTNYRLYDPIKHVIKISKNVVFNEKSSTGKKRNNYHSIVLDEDNDEKCDGENEIENDDPESESSDSSNEEFQSPSGDAENRNIRYNLRNRENIQTPQKMQLYELNLTEIETPSTYEEALEGENKIEWREAINEEITALNDNKTWEIVKLPANKALVDSKWVFKVKTTPNSDKVRFKARLCARGFTQTKGVDYKETFSPTVRYDTVRILLSIAVKRKYEIKQFDVKTAFLHGTLEEEVYMAPPKGVKIQEGYVCRLLKSLYGLKQSSRCWNKRMNKFLTSHNLEMSKTDNCVYFGKINGSEVIIAIYVDDGLIFAQEFNKLVDFMKSLNENFHAIVTEASCFVGMEIEQDLVENSVAVHVSNYIHKIIKRFGFSEANTCANPVDKNTVLSKECDSPKVDEKLYRQAIGSLMFAAIVARPDISFSVNVVSRFQNSPTKMHWNAVKRIFQYLKQTAGYKIKYSCIENDVLKGYADADFAGDPDTRRSTTGYVFLLSNGVITWCSSAQKSVSLSTAEAEYVAASCATRELMWIQKFLTELNFINSHCKTILFVDNQSAIKLIENPVFHKRTKHIDVHYHFVREKFNCKLFDIQYVNSNLQLADLLTKALSNKKLTELINLLGMC